MAEQRETDTIFAVSSGRPPAAIAVLRVSGPGAAAAAERLAGVIPEPRRATLRALRDAAGDLLDRALLLWFPGDSSATGEDLLEIHAHGGRAVINAVEHELGTFPETRRAEPGEFTRRALHNGRFDLAQAEGLADLLTAETEAQRRQALRASEGALSNTIHSWMSTLSDVAAMVEVAIDYDEEEDAGDALPQVLPAIARLRSEICDALARPPIERLRDGIRVVLAGPRNAGKSSLFNALLERDAAITSPIAGTTRDVIEAGVVRNGVAFVLIDTAGLIEHTNDPIEAIGIERAIESIEGADILLWLGDDAPPEGDMIVALHSRADAPGRQIPETGRMPVSAHDQHLVGRVWDEIDRRASGLIPVDQILFNRRQRDALSIAMTALQETKGCDLLILAEQLRVARSAVGSVIGIDATEALLDALFSRFCLGK